MANDPTVEALCREYHDAMWHHDWDRIKACFHPDIVWEDTALGHRYEGIETVIDFFRTSFPPLEIRVTVDWMIATAEGYCVDTTVGGRHVLDVFGMAATNKPFQFRVVSIGKVRDGKIVHGVDSWNLGSMLGALGVEGAGGAMPAVMAEAH